MRGYATISSAGEALRAGVADYVVKPFDLTDFRARLQRAVEGLKLRRAHRRLVSELRGKNPILEGLATRDPLRALANHPPFHQTSRKLIAHPQPYRPPRPHPLPLLALL